MSQNFVETVTRREVNYIKILQTILSRWYWLAGCLLITFSMAWVYLSVIHPRFSSNTSLLLTAKKSDIANILDPESSQSNSGEALNQTQDAMFIIRSDAFLSKAVSRLNYRYSFYYKDRWSINELYPESPFTIQIIKQDTTAFYSELFNIKWTGGGKFTLSPKEELNIDETVYRYGDTIRAPGLVFRITKSYAVKDFVYYFRFHTKQSLIARTANNLAIEPQNLNILSISHTDVNSYFSADILNAINKEYLAYEAVHRSQSSTKKLATLDEKIKELTDEMNVSGDQLEKLQKADNLRNLPAKMQADIAKLAQLQVQKDELIVEKLNIDQYQRQIIANDHKAMLNFNLEAPVQSLLSTLISQLNSQINDREKNLQKYTENSDVIKALDKDIAQTKQAIISNIQQYRSRNEAKRELVDEKIADANAEINNLPADAKELVTLQQDYTTKQKFLASLGEERLKLQLTISAIEPGVSVIYDAVPSDVAVSPNANRIQMLALIAGLGGGLFLILLARILNRRVQDIATVQSLSQIPVLGLIRRLKKSALSTENPYLPLIEDPSSVFSESVRTLRNSLVFVLSKNRGKVICISSATSGEGRTFISSNLVYSLSQLDKKVILIDADLRKPAVSKSLNPDDPGLSAYLVNYKSILSIIRHTEIPNVDMISSGVSPSNPSELIQNTRMKELINYLRNLYDYIIIDTSPVAVVSDAKPLIAQADLNLFVLRGGKSSFNAVSYMERIRKEYNLDNFFLVLNAFRNNPLYHPFDSDVDVDVYFNQNYKDYIKRYNSEIDDSKWEQFQQGKP